MAYTITPTNGQNPIVIADGTINTSTTVTLVGKNYPNYGDILDVNFIRLLENSADTTAPASPITGEIWWDSGNRSLKVYTGTAWRNVGSTTAQATKPTGTQNVGDLWWDTSTGALWGYDGSIDDYKLIGPIGGTADIASETLSDGASNHDVMSFKLGGIRYLIFSTDPAFSPSPAIDGFQTISPGLNLASTAFLTGAKFVGQASDAVTVGSIYPNAFIRADQNSSTTGTLSILNNNGLNVGASNNLKLAVASPNVSVTNQTTLGYMNFNVHNGSGTQLDAIDIYPNGNLVCNYNLHVAGSITATGGSGDMSIGTGTVSTNTITGALKVSGGAGVTGNINAGGTNSNFVGQLRAANIVSNSTITGATIGNTGTVLVGTLNAASASQTNITALGTLNSLICAGIASLTTLNISGVTTLGGAPTSALHAATKAYVDSAVSAGVGGITIPTVPSVPGVAGATGQVAFFNSANSVIGSSLLTFSGATLAVTGAITATGDITAFVSDIRLKDNIKTITNALDKVNDLSGFTYDFNSLAEEIGLTGYGRQVGLSAQDVQKVLPEAVKPAPANNEYLTVQYEKVVPLLIEAIKELTAEVNFLKNQINS